MQTGNYESRNIFCSQRDMNQIPDDMHYCGVHFLNSMDAVRRYDETIIRYFRKATAILASESYRQHLLVAGCLKRINQVGRFAARTEHHRDVARHAQEAELIDEDPSEVNVVTDRRHRGDVCHQRNHGKGRSLFDDWVIKLHAHVECIAQAASVSHYEKSSALLKTLCHRTRHHF